jgi:hypothetical protein
VQQQRGCERTPQRRRERARGRRADPRERADDDLERRAVRQLGKHAYFGGARYRRQNGCVT